MSAIVWTISAAPVILWNSKYTPNIQGANVKTLLNELICVPPWDKACENNDVNISTKRCPYFYVNNSKPNSLAFLNNVVNKKIAVNSAVTSDWLLHVGESGSFLFFSKSNKFISNMARCKYQCSHILSAELALSKINSDKIYAKAHFGSNVQSHDNSEAGLLWSVSFWFIFYYFIYLFSGK